MIKTLFQNMPFCYKARIPTIADGQTLSPQISFSNDSDFILTDLRSTGTAGVYVTLQSANGETFSNEPWHAALVGAGFNGLKVLTNPVIPANTDLVVQVQNTSGGPVTNFEVQLWGYKVNRHVG